VSPSRTRQRLTDEELLSGSVSRNKVLSRLVEGRIVTVRESSEGKAVYSIAHEALIRGWQTLDKWLAETDDQRRAESRLRLAAKEWVRLGRFRGGLWSRLQLKELGGLDIKAVSPVEREFVLASRAHARQRFWGLVFLAVGIPLAAVAVYSGLWISNERARERKVTGEVDRAMEALQRARILEDESRVMKKQAFQLFDQMKLEQAESLWTEYVTLFQSVPNQFARASQLLETALLLDRDRADVRESFADLLYERALLAESSRNTAGKSELLERLRLYDEGGLRARRWNAPGIVELKTGESDARLVLSRYELDDKGHYKKVGIGQGEGSFGPLEVAPGSYIFEIKGLMTSLVHYPLLIKRAEKVQLQVDLPAGIPEPEGFVYIPAGKFYFGSGAENQQRRDFFRAVPVHLRETAGFFIAKHETTFAQWLQFLDSLPPEAAEKHLPRVEKGGFQGALIMERLEDGWSITFQPTSTGRPFTAKYGEKIVYPGRTHRKEQDWLRFPVFGVAVADAEAYAAWLDHTGRVPGARLCNELEWERAAKGADLREYPHGERLGQDDANFDDTYQKNPLAMGPDEVGSHPVSDSPFGVSELAGNVWEWCRSALKEGGYVARGGSYYYGPNTAKTAERATPEISFRDTSVGVRICASPVNTR